jgi:hypothetical protein
VVVSKESAGSRATAATGPGPRLVWVSVDDPGHDGNVG